MKGVKSAGLGGILVLVTGCAEPTVETPPVRETGAEILPGTGTQNQPGSAERAAKPAPPQGKITEVDLNRLLQLQDEGTVYLVDVRPPLFYGLGHIPGAVNVARKSFPLSLVKHQEALDAAVAAGKVVVLYCQNVQCPDGYAVGRELADMGYSTSLYKGGWEEWKQMGF